MGSSTATSRFMSKIRKDAASGCWLWTGSLGTTGYGQFSFGGRPRKAHRVAYELFVGAIPRSPGFHGTVVMHACDERRCVNPAHLLLGSQHDNVDDMNTKGRGRPPRGESHSRVRFSDAQIAAIRDASGSCKAIALSFGASAGYVSRLRRHLKRPPSTHLSDFAA